MEKYYVISCYVLWRELCYFAAVSRNMFQFHFLKQGLHNTPDVLREQVQQAIDGVNDGYSAVLLGYGLCSNGLVGVIARDVPIVVMRGHDCITFLLGSKDRYREYFDQRPGTYWYSPGWIDTNEMPGKERYEKTLRHYIDTYGEENARYLMEAEQSWVKNYDNAAYVDLGFYDTEHHKRFTRECADALGWNCDIIAGDPQLIRNFLEGDWNSDDFLIVEPGEEIIASHDERVLGTRRRAPDGGGTC